MLDASILQTLVTNVLLIVAAVLAVLAALWVLSSAVAWFITGVPFVPTRTSIINTMISLARIQSSDTVYELGCGDGRLLFRLSKVPNYVGKRVGYEIVPTLAWWAQFYGWLRRDAAKFHRADFFTVDLSDADVILCYLFPHIMDRFIAEIVPQLQSGTRIVSHSFSIPGLALHEKTITHGEGIYTYIIE